MSAARGASIGEPSAPGPASAAGTAPHGAGGPRLRRHWPTTAEEWTQVFEARSDAARRDPPTAFFFELDWNVAPDLADAARRAGLHPVLTTGEWIEVREALDRRLARRCAGLPPGRSLPAPIVGRLSRMIHAAAAKLPPREQPATRVVKAFGAGRLASTIAFGTTDDPGAMRINDADSYFIWMFAEFGLVSTELGIDREAWRDLLPSLLLAGWFYGHRFRRDATLKPMPLSWYLRPGRALRDEEIDACRAAFDAIREEARRRATTDEAWHAAALEACLRRVTTG